MKSRSSCLRLKSRTTFVFSSIPSGLLDMVIITPTTGLLSYNEKGRFSIPNGLGVIFLGWNSLGYEEDRAGTYQRHRTSKGKATIKLWQNWPSNPKYPNQVARQNVFANAVLAWQALTPEERYAYNHTKNLRGKTGYNLFLGNYLKTH